MSVNNDRIEEVQEILNIMDMLFKEHKLSLVIREGKAAIIDHEADVIYKINHLGGDTDGR